MSTTDHYTIANPSVHEHSPPNHTSINRYRRPPFVSEMASSITYTTTHDRPVGFVPVNKPCIILYDNFDPDPGFMQVRKDAMGYIIEERTEPMTGRVVFKIGLTHEEQFVNGHRKGWVQPSMLAIALDREDDPYEQRRLTRPLTEIGKEEAAQTTEATGIFETTIFVVADELLKISEARDMVSPSYFAFAKQHTPILIAKQTSAGVKKISPGLLHVFDSTSFTLDDVLTPGCAEHITATKNDGAGKGAGIYLIAYEFEDGTMKLYMGQTISWGDRNKQHYKSWRSAQDSPDAKMSLHYREARLAKSMKMYKLASIDDADLRNFAEQLFVGLFRTIAQEVYLWMDENDEVDMSGSSQSQSGSDADEAVEEDMHIMLGFTELKGHGATATDTDSEESENDTSGSSIWADKKLWSTTATFFSSLFKKVVIASGWGFTGQYAGLNTLSPLGCRMSTEQIVWTRDTLHPNYFTYRRPDVQVRKAQANEKGRMLSVAGTQNRFVPSIPPDVPGLAVGTKVQIVVEITRDESPHPYRFALMPTIGPFRNWAKALSIGIAIVYEDEDGSWRRTYLRGQNVMDWTRDKDRLHVFGAPNSYTRMIGLYRYLTQEVVLDLPEWALDMGVARVFDVVIDHLAGTLDFHPSLPKAVQKLRTTDDNGNRTEPVFDQSEIEDQLDDLGLENIDGKHGQRVASVLYRSTRTKCDRCFIAQNNSPRAQRQIQGDGCSKSDATSDICGVCNQFGVPCTWTNNLDWNDTSADNQRALDALSAPADKNTYTLYVDSLLPFDIL
ncbi:Hypothetical protein D9617_35g090100 [Elsinoe fawcettii]|nr:Hypothetical protein D9617_35g090100 [Elsinoe fawcettii]